MKDSGQINGDNDDNNNDKNDYANTADVDVEDDNADNEDDDWLLTLHDAPARSDSRVYQSQGKTVLIPNRRPDHPYIDIPTPPGTGWG